MAKNIATTKNKAVSNASVQAIVFLLSGNMVSSLRSLFHHEDQRAGAPYLSDSKAMRGPILT
jgi:hypothetical protein